MAVAGKVACTPKGEWVTGTAYEVIDIVRHNGASWLSKADSNTEEPTAGAEKWIMLVTDGEDGTNGTNGTDGVSPTISVSKSGKVTTITITDANGTHSFEVKDGEDGDGSGDMLKSVYDPDNDGLVDEAKAVEWSGVKNVLYDTEPTADSERLMMSKDIKTAVEGRGNRMEYSEDESKLRLFSGTTMLSEVTIEGGGAAIKLGDVSGAAVSSHMEEVYLTWSDPSDIVVDGTPLATWAGTLVVRKAGSAPTGHSDGTVVLDNTVRNQYASEAFTDDQVVYGETYYYRFFPYTTTGSYTNGSSVSVTPGRITIESVPTQSGTLTYDGTEQTAAFTGYDTEKMTAAGITGINAGDYTATFTPKEGYCWADGSVTGKEIGWTIGKASVTIPTVDASVSLTYTGSAQTGTFNDYDPAKMSVTGNTATDAGTHAAVFSLSDSDNYTWAGGSVADQSVNWTIGKADQVITPQETAVTLNGTTPSKMIGISQTGDGAITAESSNPSVVTASVSGLVLTISSVNHTNGSATVTLSAAETTNYKAGEASVTVNASFSQIYGVEWDGTSTTKWSRTDAAEGFTDPVPAVNNGTGSSPFDTISPWKDMTKEERAGGTMVKIPKFYYKLSKSGKVMKLQISMTKETGFSVSPAHMDRGDGAGERDVVYVSRYHCADSTYKSTTGVKPMANVTRADFRTNIHKLGGTIWQYDYATLLTIQMLYLVEFADWNSQATIGYGCGNNSSTENMGSTDAMQYHTGTNAESRTTYGHTQYRNIEDLWGNVFDWCDGVYFSGADIYAIKNPANFSDTTGGTKVGTRPTSSNYISEYAISSVSGFEYFMYPTAVAGSEATYICDYCDYNASGVVLYVGGYYNQGQNRGLFYLGGYNAASNKNAVRGSRLLELPSAA